MKRSLLVAILLLFCIGAASAQMQFGGGAQAGIDFASFPKPIDQIYGTGYGFGGHGDLLIMKYLGVRLSIDYRTFSSDKGKLAAAYASLFTFNGVQADPSQTSVTGLNTSDLSFMLSGIGRLPTGSIVTPYALLGLGLHVVSASNPTISYQGQDITQQLLQQQIIMNPTSATKFGIHFGAGGELSLGMVKLFLEVKYVVVFTQNNSTSFIPIEVGITL